MDKNDKILKYIQQLLLIASVWLLCLENFARETAKVNLLQHLLLFCIVPGLIVVIGYRAARWEQEGCLRRKMLKQAAMYYMIYVVVGASKFVWMNQHTWVDSILKLMLLEKVPKYTDIYFTMMLLTAVSAFAIPTVKKLMKWPIICLIVSATALTITWLPQDLIGYPVLGAWVGTNVYRCIPLLAYAGYYLFGCWIGMRGEQQKVDKKMTAALCGGAVISIGVIIWQFERLVEGPMEYPMCYWEILAGAGFAAVIGCLVTQPRLSNGFNRLMDRFFAWQTETCVFIKTMLILVMFMFIRGEWEWSKLPTSRAVIIGVVCWFIATAVTVVVAACLNGRMIGWLKKHRKTGYLCIYTLGFVVVFVLVYLPFIEQGYSLIWGTDALSQYFPKAVDFSRTVREAITSLLNGHFKWYSYDFSLGLGDSAVLKFEPLYWMHALFTPEDMEKGYEIVLIIRIYAAGLSFSALCLYLKKRWQLIWLGSYIYCFSGYLVYVGTRHAHFIVPFILLPLLVIAVEEILRRKRWYMGSALIALSLLCSYYFLYINSIALVVYFLFRFFYMPKEQRTLRQFLEYLGLFVLAYALGVGMGCLTIFTSISNYLGSSRSGAGNMTAASLLTYRETWVQDVYMHFLTSGDSLGHWMKLGFLPVSYLSIVIVFMKKQKKVLKACLTACLLCLPFPVAAYVLSGFGNVMNRWLYIMALVVTLVTIEALPKIYDLTRREMKILFISTLPYCGIALFYSKYNDLYTMKALALLLLTLVVMLLSVKTVNVLTRQQSQIAMVLVVIISLFVSGDMLYGENGQQLMTSEYIPSGEVMNEATEGAISGCTAIEDDSFYRVTEGNPQYTKLCAPSILNVKSISYFNSVLNSKIHEYGIVMGNVGVGLVGTTGFNNRSMLNAFASVKYYGAYEGQPNMLPYGYDFSQQTSYNGKNYDIYGTDATLPLGYTYDAVLDRADFEDYPVEARQEVMMTNAVIESDTTLNQTYDSAQPVTTGYEIPVQNIELNNVTWEDQKIDALDGGTITFYVDPVMNSELYLVFKGDCKSKVSSRDYMYMIINSANGSYNYSLRETSNIYYMELDAYMFNIGYNENGTSSFTIQFSGAGEINLEDWAVYCQPMDGYVSELDALKADQLANVIVDGGDITGTIATDQEKLLVLSIPYQNGWKAYVDGKQVELMNVNILYMGLELSPGNHTIALHYEQPGLQTGLKITMVSIIIFICLMSADIYRRKRRQA